MARARQPRARPPRAVYGGDSPAGAFRRGGGGPLPPSFLALHVDVVADRGAVLQLGREAALLEADDLDGVHLPRLGVEGVRGLHLELVALEVAEEAVAVAAVDELHRDLVVAGDDAAVEDLELLALLEVAVDVHLRVDGRAVERVRDGLEVERRSHLVAVQQDGLRAGGDVAADHHLLQVHEARLGPEDLLLEIGDALLERPDLELVLLVGGEGGLARVRRGGLRRGGALRLPERERRQRRAEETGQPEVAHVTLASGKNPRESTGKDSLIPQGTERVLSRPFASSPPPRRP